MAREIRLKYLCSSFSTPIAQQEVNKKGTYEVYGASGLVGYLDNYSCGKQYLGIVKDGAGVGRVNKYEKNSSLLGTMAYIVPNEGIDINWLMYVISALDLGKDVGKTTIPHIYFSNYGNKAVYYLPLPEQEKIATFLDSECARIDEVISKTKSTIEEYKKLKQSVITEAVTKGIRPNREMKDSGIEWIGEIPKEWDVVRVKNLFDYRNEKNFKPLNEVNLISLYTDLGVVQHCDLEATTGNKASNADGYKLVFEDDIVVNIILCWMGAIGRSAYTGVTSPAYDVYSPKAGTNSKFYHHLFRTQGFSGDCYKVGRGIMAMRWRTYSDQFRAIEVVAPPKSEQEEIVAYLDQKCTEIDTLIAKKEQIVSELESYKKSLIYEYVTGKKEVV